MMAGLFLLMTGVFGFLFFGKRRIGMWLLLATLVLCAAMLYYHATSELMIKW